MRNRLRWGLITFSVVLAALLLLSAIGLSAKSRILPRLPAPVQENIILFAATFSVVLSGVAAFAQILGRGLLDLLHTRSQPVQAPAEDVELPPPAPAFDVAYSRRLQKYLELVNQASHSDQLGIPELAEILGFERVSQLQRYFDGEEEPPLPFLDRFGTELGVNSIWLKRGTGEPFKTSIRQEYNPEDNLATILELHPQLLIFVRNRSLAGQVCIVLWVSKWKFQLLDGDGALLVHVSGQVGDTGARRLFEFHNLVSQVSDKHLPTIGCHVDDPVFWDLHNGVLYPGFLRSPGIVPPPYPPGTRVSYSLWWYDLLDATHEKASSEYYRKEHGEQFVAAQEEIAHFLRRRREGSGA